MLSEILCIGKLAWWLFGAGVLFLAILLTLAIIGGFPAMVEEARDSYSWNSDNIVDTLYIFVVYLGLVALTCFAWLLFLCIVTE